MEKLGAVLQKGNCFQEPIFLSVPVASIHSKVQLQASSVKLSTSSVLFVCIRKEEMQPLLVNSPYCKSCCLTEVTVVRNQENYWLCLLHCLALLLTWLVSISLSCQALAS